MNITFGELAAFLGIPAAITGFFFWLIQRSINKRDAKLEAERVKREARYAKLEADRKKMDLMLINGVNASIALGEATARAVQRIPDAHCNGDMSDALQYAAKIKHEQKDFLTVQGIEHLHTD